MRRSTFLPALLAFACAVALMPRASAAPDAPEARQWSPSAPMAPVSAPSLQSEPSVALRGSRALVAYTDSRNSAPDVYASIYDGGTRAADSRVSNLAPDLADSPAAQGSAVIEASGRAFVAYSDGEQIWLARYDVAGNSWLSRTQVSPTGAWNDIARAPSLAGDGNGALIVTWEDFRNTTSDNRAPDVYARACNGATLTCSAEVKLNGDSGANVQRRPRVAMNGANAVVVWEDHRERGPESPRIFARFSTNAGASWGVEARVNKDGGGGLATTWRSAAVNPAVAYAADGSVFAAWEQSAGSATAPPDIYAAVWNGAAWSTPARVDTAPARVRTLMPTLAGSSAGMFAAWTDYRNGSRNPDVYSARWNGSAWVESAVVTNSAAQTRAALGADGANVRVAWQDERGGSPDVYAASWNGSAWTGESMVHDNPGRAAPQQYVAMDNSSGSYAAFSDTREGYRQIWLAQLTSNALPTWTIVSPFPTGAESGEGIADTRMDIAGNGAGLHATWVQWQSSEGATVMHASYSGGVWSERRALSAGTGDVNRGDPSIAARNDVVAVAWMHFGDGGQHQVYAAWLRDGSWSAPVTVLPSARTLWNGRPSVAIDAAGRVHVAYGDSQGNGRGTLMLASRDANASTWTYRQISPTVNSDWCGQHSPQLRADSVGTLHIAWSGCALKNPPSAWPHESWIFYASSSDGGATWSQPLKVAKTDATDDNNTDSQPALGLGPPGELMLVYPAQITGGTYGTYAALLTNGALNGAPYKLGDSNWLQPGTYYGRWFGGDGRGAAGFDGAGMRFVLAYSSRASTSAPAQLYAAAYGEQNIRRTYLPLTRR